MSKLKKCIACETEVNVIFNFCPDCGRENRRMFECLICEKRGRTSSMEYYVLPVVDKVWEIDLMYKLFFEENAGGIRAKRIYGLHLSGRIYWAYRFYHNACVEKIRLEFENTRRSAICPNCGKTNHMPEFRFPSYDFNDWVDYTCDGCSHPIPDYTFCANCGCSVLKSAAILVEGQTGQNEICNNYYHHYCAKCM